MMESALGDMTGRDTTPTKTLVTLLLDRSGSMQSIKDDTIGGINAYCDRLRESGQDIRFSLVQFDSEPGVGIDLKKVCVARPIRDVTPLRPNEYHPRGMTPLIDAACATIRAVEQSLSDQPDRDAIKVVIAIQTDGCENASLENGWSDLKALIAEKEALGWQFNFMGTGIDAYVESNKFGLGAGKTVSYGKTAAGTRAAFAAQAENTVAFAAGTAIDTSYSTSQKMASGDHAA